MLNFFVFPAQLFTFFINEEIVMYGYLNLNIMNKMPT